MLYWSSTSPINRTMCACSSTAKKNSPLPCCKFLHTCHSVSFVVRAGLYAPAQVRRLALLLQMVPCKVSYRAPISNLSMQDYVRLLKYGDSLYRCKQLKRAALGRMCTLMKRQGPSLAYLEQARLMLLLPLLHLAHVHAHEAPGAVAGLPGAGAPAAAAAAVMAVPSCLCARS